MLLSVRNWSERIFLSSVSCIGMVAQGFAAFQIGFERLQQRLFFDALGVGLLLLFLRDALEPQIDEA